MIKWEYMTILLDYSEKDISVTLNKQGEKGWELVVLGDVSHPDLPIDKCPAIFKRPIEPPRRNIKKELEE